MRAITRLTVVLMMVPVIAAGSVAADGKMARAKPHSAHCAVPRGWREVAHDAQAIVTRQARHHKAEYGFRWRYCLPAKGRFLPLFTDSGIDPNLATIVTHERPLLKGHYVADLTRRLVADARVGECHVSIGIVNLETGVHTRGFSGGCGAPVSSLVLNARGFAAWHVASYPVQTSTNVNAISCPSVAFCVAVDAAGDVLTSTDPAGGRDAWTTSNVNGASAIDSISCPSIQFCAAVAGDTVLTSADPTGGPAAWKSVTLQPAGERLESIACPSTSLCVAAGVEGQIVVSSDPVGDASAWSTINADGGRAILGVSCPSPSLCVAVDDRARVLTTTDPTSVPWTVTRAFIEPHTHYLHAISCPSISLCVGSAYDQSNGDIVVSTDPTGGPSAWTLAHIDGNREPVVITCPSTSLCVGFDSGDDLLTSTDPAGGPSAWTVRPFTAALPPGATGPTAVSCPSTSMCIALDGPDIFTSATPSSGSSWTSSPVDVPDCAVTTPCEAEAIYVHDSHGTRVVDSAPPGSGHTLTELRLHGNELSWMRDGTTEGVRLG